MATPIRNPLAGILEYGIRPGTADDLGFVVETMSKSLYPEYRRDTRLRDFRAWHKRHVEKLLDADDTRLVVAGPSDDPSTIYGYALLGPLDVVHFLYVRNVYRRCGIARALLWDDRSVLTHTRLTEDARAIKAGRPEFIRYIPND